MEAKLEKDLPSNETVLEQLNWRYATKSFNAEKKISEKDWETLQQALILAPSSYGLQPYKFVVITDEELKAKLRPAAYNQPQITDSSHLVVFATKKVLNDEFVEEYVERVEEIRGTPREKWETTIEQMKGKMKQLSENDQAVSWSQRQAYIALGFLLETAAVLGIDACPMEGFDPSKFDEVLGLEGYTASALCTLGYRADDDWMKDLAKVRFSEEKLIDRR